VCVDHQLGLEKTPTEYVAKLVEGFREVRRVLRDDGVLFLNLGDTYASQGGSFDPSEWENKQSTNRGSSERTRRAPIGLKPKDLVGIPWSVAFALRDDGWYLRSDIIWHKPSPMPESVTDRPTKSHEYIFLLSKNPTYFYDGLAIAEPLTRPEESERKTPARFGGADKWEEAQKQSRLHSGNEYVGTPTGTRNKRTVWTVPSAPYAEAHFATYPPDLIKPCILAGTSAKGCCPKCGAPWERVVETNNPSKDSNIGEDLTGGAAVTDNPQTSKGLHRNGGGVYSTRQTVNWQPTCECMVVNDHVAPDQNGYTSPLEPIPCTVLDCFAGSGASGQVALELGRNAILIELNPKYIELIRQRTNVTPGLALA